MQCIRSVLGARKLKSTISSPISQVNEDCRSTFIIIGDFPATFLSASWLDDLFGRTRNASTVYQ